MTLASTAPLRDYLENGVTVTHTIPFQFTAASEIVCSRIPVGGVETPLVQGTDYSVTGGNGSTGSVIKTNGGIAGNTFRIKRVTSQSQSTSFINDGSFPAADVEKAFDREMAVVQEEVTNRVQLEARSIHGAPGDSIATIASPASRASKFMQFAADGKSVLMQTAAQLAAIVAPSVVPLLDQGFKGDPGGNAMAIGLFIFAGGMNIPVGTDLVQTSGYSTVGTGYARYAYDAAVDAAYVAAHPKSSFLSSNGRGFKYAEPIADLRHLGAAADLVTDDHDAMAAAIATGRPISLGGASYKMTGGHVLPSDTLLMGPGRIEFDASLSVWLFALGSDAGAVAVSNVAIERIHFTCSSDVAFVHILRLSNPDGSIDGVRFSWNVIDYTPATLGAGDRWVIAGTGNAPKTNFQIIGNRVTGPMQLVASAPGSGSLKHWQILFNRVFNARSNAISLLCVPGVGTPNTIEDVEISYNDISADTYTTVGIIIGLDGSNPDRYIHMHRITIRGNRINLVASGGSADIYIRIGDDCSNIGGQLSDADTIVVEDNELHGSVTIDQAPVVTAAGFTRITNFMFARNRIYGGDIILCHLADGAACMGNKAYVVGVRPGANNGRIDSSGNQWGGFTPIDPSAEFNWNAVNDCYLGYPTGTDKVFSLNAALGKVQTANLESCTIDSHSSGLRYAAISVQGAGNPSVTVRNLSSSTAWNINPNGYERIAGTITDYTGGLFVSTAAATGPLDPGQSSAELTLNNVYGAQVGDSVTAVINGNGAGLQVFARVTAANTITYYFHNPTGNPNGTQNIFIEVFFRFRSFIE